MKHYRVNFLQLGTIINHLAWLSTRKKLGLLSSKEEFSRTRLLCFPQIKSIWQVYHNFMRKKTAAQVWIFLSFVKILDWFFCHKQSAGFVEKFELESESECKGSVLSSTLTFVKGIQFPLGLHTMMTWLRFAILRLWLFSREILEIQIQELPCRRVRICPQRSRQELRLSSNGIVPV